MPLRSGMVNPARALGETVAVVIKRRDSQVEWDGARFSGLHSPVLFQTGISAFSASLKELGHVGSDGSKSRDQLVHMLLKGRVEVALGLEPSASVAMQCPGVFGAGVATQTLYSQQRLSRV